MPTKTSVAKNPEPVEVAPSLTLATPHTLTFSEEEVAMIKATVAKECDEHEFKIFLRACERTGLDPLQRQIYAIHRTTDGKKRMTIQTSIDGFRLIADRSGRYAGSDAPIYDTDTAPHPSRATVTVYKMVEGQRCPFTSLARWDEYVPTYYDSKKHAHVPMHMWQKMGYHMLGKCGESLSLRKAFPQELSGLYTHDEMQQADMAAAVVDEQSSAGVKPEASNGGTTDTPPTSVKVEGDPEQVRRIALQAEIRAGFATIKQYKHFPLLAAIAWECFRCASDQAHKQTLPVYEDGIERFRFLCAELVAQGEQRPALEPAEWIALTLRRREMAQARAVAAGATVSHGTDDEIKESHGEHWDEADAEEPVLAEATA